MPLVTRHSTLDTPRRRPRRRGGFTLAELMVVVALMAIIAGIGIVRLSRASVLMTQGERVARQLVADLRRAQSQAITDGRNHYLLFTDGGAKYTDYALYRAEAGGVQVEPDRVLPDGVAVTGSATRAEFAPGGDALAAYTYTVTCPGWAYTIQVTLATGAVAMTADRD